MLCVVNPWHASSYAKSNLEAEHLWESLAKEETIFYTDYFSQLQAIISIDLDRGRGKKKYSIKELCPKGILLGKISYFKGNNFFRGILDGHLDILKLRYGLLNSNLILYCIRLAGQKADDTLITLKKMYWKECAFYLGDRNIPNVRHRRYCRSSRLCGGQNSV